MIMVKPSLPYLDVIVDASEIAKDHPIACYQVSGEFAMIHAGAKAGVYDLRSMAFETTESMVRAGTSSTGFDRALLCSRVDSDRCDAHPQLFHPTIPRLVR